MKHRFKAANGAAASATPARRRGRFRAGRCWQGMLLAAVCGVMATVAAVRADDWIYTVRPGDTLWDLTRRHLKHGGYVERL